MILTTLGEELSVSHRYHSATKKTCSHNHAPLLREKRHQTTARQIERNSFVVKCVYFKITVMHRRKRYRKRENSTQREFEAAMCTQQKTRKRDRETQNIQRDESCYVKLRSGMTMPHSGTDMPRLLLQSTRADMPSTRLPPLSAAMPTRAE